MHHSFGSLGRVTRSVSIVLLIANLVSGFAAVAETLRMRADSWMPYNGDPKSDTPGYAIEIARIICEKNGITLDYQTMPWGEALKAATANEIEAVVGANKDEAVGLVMAETPIGMPRIALMVPKASTWSYKNVASLHAVRLGVIKDYKYWPALDDYLVRASDSGVVRFDGEHPLEAAMAKLNKGEIDVLAETSSVFVWTAKNSNYPIGAFRMAYLHEGDPVHFAFAQKAGAGDRYARLFEAGIRELRQGGELAKILARYGQSDWE